MRILLVDDRIPDPHFGAGFPRAYRLLMTLLELGHEIFFMPTRGGNLEEVNVGELRECGIEPVSSPEGLRGISAAIISRPHNVHYQLARIREALPGVKAIYDTEALWYRRYDLQMSVTGRLPSWAYRYDELGLARQVDLCFTVNDEERLIMEGAGVRRVVKLGHALDVHEGGARFSERRDFLTVGGILEEDSSNEDGLWWYLENVWEGIRARTGAEMLITGIATSPRLLSHKFPGVRLLGHVGDLVPLYETCRVFAAATRFATGIPWKVHEAMAHGIPCLVSGLLEHQLRPREGELICARTPEEYVERGSLLYEDEGLWERTRGGGYELIRRDCRPEGFREILERSLAELVRG